MKYLVAFVVFYSKVCGNTIKSDDLNSIPPLYDLEEWTQCQTPGDIYCIVDAALVTEDAAIFKKLQDYSDQTLKRYNRTGIHRGVCVTRCRSQDADENFWDSAQRCLNRSLLSYGFEAQVESVGWCSKAGADIPASLSARALAVLCTGMVAFGCLATALHVLGDRCVKADGNKYLIAFSLKRNWEILTYDRRKPRSDERMKDVACLEGIRFLGMQCIIFFNVFLIHIYSFIDNPEFVENMYDQLGWKVLLNMPIWFQAFFSISGFLTAYGVLLSSAKSPITINACFMAIINRWVRLTPMALFVLWFTIAWFPLLGSGPQWARLVAREAVDCSERWWYHALYIHNYLPTGQLCLNHTWYLAVDIQLHVLGIFLLFFLMKHPNIRMSVLLGMVLSSAAAAGAVTYWHQLMPIITAQSPEAIRTLFAGSKILRLLYLPVWMNLPGYVIGLATAFILHHNQLVGVKIKQKKWFNILFHTSLVLGGCVTLVGTIFLSDSTPPEWVSVVYAALDRTLVAVCFNVFLLGCFSRCQSAIRDLLEFRCFHVLGRLSYCVFLVHFIVLRLLMAGNTQLSHVSILAMVSLSVSTSVLSYAVSIPLCLLVELPALQLWNALLKENREPTPVRTLTVPPQPVVTPFDLVSQLRKRHDFC